MSTSIESIREQLKNIIVGSLRLTDVRPSALRDAQALLGGDLEIDSIDVLQLVLGIERHFGIKLVTGEFDREAWSSVSSLAALIEERIRQAE